LIETLTFEEVLSIHYALVAYFKDEGDPIDPAGPRSEHLLHSAISRQHVSFETTMKYGEPRGNAATLLYGICMNHSFHNGNKRTAFVSALVHLERNGYIPTGVTHDEFYNMLLALSDHRLTNPSVTPRGGRNISQEPAPKERLQPDEEVRIVSEWLRKRTRREDKRQHPLTFRQLRKILGRYGFNLENPQGNFIDITRRETVEKRRFMGLASPKKITNVTNITQIAYPGEGAIVQVNTIKKVRKECRLLPEDGVDSRSFYDAESTLDSILNEYRLMLNRLSKT
jgi:death-on-curing family protein